MVPPSLPSLLPFVLISACVIAVALAARARAAVPPVLLVVAGLGFAGGLLRIEGVTGLAAAAGLLWMQGREEISAKARIAACVALVLLALALALHRVPGFSPLLWQTGFGREGARDLLWQLDKACAGLLLLGWVGARPPRASVSQWLSMVVLGALVMVGLALLFGLAQWSPLVPTGFVAWALGNLLIVALAEEVFFRGVLQARLERLLAARTAHAGVIAVLAVALLFGLAHLGWGRGFACAATLAGLFYGAAFRMGGLPGAVLAHALTNMSLVLLTHSALG
ncbi:CPBP family intramembrane glutamic endopeptidase [Niveibacterium sp. SC-1]|uniref:CPBP family intramembrane glutamic endopeptidase n=1 Tax=Niveibacterium sp. SC-1 TaxID=3135646 RepID=UPI00311FE439